MHMPKTFLLCDNEVHADFVDKFIMDELRERDGSKGSSWSGVFTDGTRYGILWGQPASSLFGQPITVDPEDGDPSVVLVDEVLDEDGISNWTAYVPPPEQEQETP